MDAAFTVAQATLGRAAVAEMRLEALSYLKCITYEKRNSLLRRVFLR
jgi:hypothetical protein